MSLEFLTREATDRLANCLPQNLEAYRTGQTEVLIQTGDCRLSRIETVTPPVLGDLTEPRQDAQASMQIYQWLSSLSPVQAADDRLWVYLTHRQFAAYVQKRWGGGFERSENPESFVQERWFFSRRAGMRTLFHNAVSRLWWFAHVSHDPRRANPFELTEVLLFRQDIQQAFLERSIGMCRPLLKAVLETILHHGNRFPEIPISGDIYKAWAKQLHLYGGARILDAVPEARLRVVVEQMFSSLLHEHAQ